MAAAAATPPIPAPNPTDVWVGGSWTVDCSCDVTFDDGEEMINYEQFCWLGSRGSGFQLMIQMEATLLQRVRIFTTADPSSNNLEVVILYDFKCDTIWTEKLYFSSDAAFLGYSLILTILRTSSLRDEASRVMVAAPILAFVTTHIMYLNFYELDKGRRKDLNILKQAFISYQLLASASTMHISLSAEFDYSVGPTIGLWGNENKSFEAIRTNRFCMALHITVPSSVHSCSHVHG
uniref:Post-GPI attachment to proteins factor 3 n=1 Tax=Zea mays TaxID=4577 RepID=A0A804Q8J3_MAIZE